MKLKSNKNMFALIMDKLGSWSLLILIGVVMAFANSKFLTSSNILNVLRQIAVVTIGAVGVSFVILGGGFDLSTGMIATFAGCNSAALIVNHVWPILPAMLFAIAIGVVIGSINGVLITHMKIAPFICTLGMQYVVNGLILVTTKSVPITGLPEAYLYLGRGFIFDVFPVPVAIMLLFVLVGHILLKYTIFGRSIIAIGENEVAAKLSGLNVNLVKVAMYAFCGF